MRTFVKIGEKPLFVVLLRMVLAAFAIVTFLRGEFIWCLSIVFSLFLTLAPSILRRDFNVRLPIIFEIGITLSVFLHLVGGYVGLYWTWGYYDHITHFISSLTVSMIGVTLLYILAYSFKVICLPPLGFGIFTVLFAMSVGVVWEFLEWFSDWAWATGLQVDLHDTMWDLVFDTLAGVIIGSAATLRLKREKKLDVVVHVDDLKSSVGYKRWKALNQKNQMMRKAVVKTFQDPEIVGKVIDFVVEESKEISQAQKKLWQDLKRK